MSREGIFTNLIFPFLPAILTIVFIIFWDKYMEKKRIAREEKKEKERKEKHLHDLLEEMKQNNKIARDNWKEWRKLSDLAYRDAKRAKYLNELSEETQQNIKEGYSIITGILDHNIEVTEGNVMEIFRIFEMRNTIFNFEKYLREQKII